MELSEITWIVSQFQDILSFFLYISINVLQWNLFVGKEGKTLDMATRLDIATDVAHAITYLHMYTRKSDL